MVVAGDDGSSGDDGLGGRWRCSHWASPAIRGANEKRKKNWG